MFDLLLGSLLLLVLPIRAILCRAPRPLRVRLRSSVAIIAGLLILLAVRLWAADLGPAAIGLGVPTGPDLALLVLPLPLIAGLAWAIRRTPPADHAMIPVGRSERRWFGLFACAAGFGWEALYRGYLLLALPPLIGSTPAILLAASAYALGHGVSGWRGFAATLASALAFTLAYWCSGSLWWLVVLHIGLALVPLLARAPVTRS